MSFDEGMSGTEGEVGKPSVSEVGIGLGNVADAERLCVLRLRRVDLFGERGESESEL